VINYDSIVNLSAKLQQRDWNVNQSNLFTMIVVIGLKEDTGSKGMHLFGKGEVNCTSNCYYKL
jgi:hypothetical protein